MKITESPPPDTDLLASPAKADSPSSTEAEQKGYAGHRDRLRDRFLAAGPEALSDYELLELLLFQAIPRRDVKPLAKKLLAVFQNDLCALVAAAPTRLATLGLSKSAIVSLKSVEAISKRAAQAGLRKRPILSSWAQLTDYLQIAMGMEEKEQFRLLFLNKKNELICDEIQQKGTVDHTPVYPREVVKRALELGATALILVHNHPSGDPTPSNADIEMTATLCAAAAPLGVEIHDHIIVSRNGQTSFKSMGLI